MGRKLINWHILSPRFPPEKGGIASYSENIAEGLAVMGESVHVWCSQYPDDKQWKPSDLLNIHRTSLGWQEEAFARIASEIGEMEGLQRVFVQYAPKAFGGSYNHHLAPFLAHCKEAGAEIWVMIHDTYEPIRFVEGPKAWRRTYNERRMLRDVIYESEKILVATPSWAKSIEPYLGPEGRVMTWLPLPSNVPLIEDQRAVENLRKAFGDGAATIIGSFGTFKNPYMLNALAKVGTKLLSESADRVWLCLGRGSEEYIHKLRKQHPGLAARMQMAGELSVEALSAHIQVCDVFLQPYLKGVSTQRSSCMAGLVHGKAISTTIGRQTEEIWKKTGCVKLAKWGDLEGLRRNTEDLIRNPSLREDIGKKGKEVYTEHFSLEQGVQKLLQI